MCDPLAIGHCMYMISAYTSCTQCQWQWIPGEGGGGHHDLCNPFFCKTTVYHSCSTDATNKLMLFNVIHCTPYSAKLGSKIHVSPNEAYASVELHKPEEVHIYEELGNATQSQGIVITTRNEAYVSWTMQHSNQLMS